MREYRIERQQDADAVARGLTELYPSYIFTPMKPKHCRLWRIACVCRATLAFLQWAKE